MAIKTYSVVLSDGSVGTRKSPRPYTRAIVVTFTQAHLDRRVNAEFEKIQVLESNITALEPLAATPEDKAAYAAASARFAYLNEVITREERGVVVNKPRWLTDEFNAGHRGTNHGFDECRKNEEALHKTFQYQINRARADIELAQKRIERYQDQYAVGRCMVYGWSQTPTGARKQSDAASKAFPLAEVIMRDDIKVTEPGSRGPRILIKVSSDAAPDPTDEQTNATVNRLLFTDEAVR